MKKKVHKDIPRCQRGVTDFHFLIAECPVPLGAFDSIRAKEEDESSAHRSSQVAKTAGRTPLAGRGPSNIRRNSHRIHHHPLEWNHRRKTASELAGSLFFFHLSIVAHVVIVVVVTWWWRNCLNNEKTWSEAAAAAVDDNRICCPHSIDPLWNVEQQCAYSTHRVLEEDNNFVLLGYASWFMRLCACVCWTHDTWETPTCESIADICLPAPITQSSHIMLYYITCNLRYDTVCDCYFIRHYTWLVAESSSETPPDLTC